MSDSQKEQKSAVEYIYSNSEHKIPVKIQLSIHAEIIEKSIADKIPLKHIYDKLISDKKINCSYLTFLKHIKKNTETKFSLHKEKTETPKPEKFQPVVKEKQQFKPVVVTDDLKDSLF